MWLAAVRFGNRSHFRNAKTHKLATLCTVWYLVKIEEARVDLIFVTMREFTLPVRFKKVL